VKRVIPFSIHPTCKPLPGRESIAKVRDQKLAAEPYGGLQWLGASERYFLGTACDICGEVFQSGDAVTCLGIVEDQL